MITPEYEKAPICPQLERSFYPQETEIQLTTVGKESEKRNGLPYAFLETSEQVLKLGEILGGGYYGLVFDACLGKEEHPVAVKTTAPDLLKETARFSLGWNLYPFPSRFTETAARHDYLAHLITKKVIEWKTNGRVTVPDSYGYCFLRGVGYCQLIEYVTDAHPPITKEEVEATQRMQEELLKISFNNGLVQIAGQIHPLNPIGMKNLWIKDDGGFVWVDTEVAIPMTKPRWFAYHRWEKKFVRDNRRKFNPFNTIHVFDVLKTLKEDNPPEAVARSLEPLVRTYGRTREQLDRMLQKPRREAMKYSAMVLENATQEKQLEEKIDLKTAEITLSWALWNLLVQELSRGKETESIKMVQEKRLVSGTEIDRWLKFLFQLFLAKTSPGSLQYFINNPERFAPLKRFLKSTVTKLVSLPFKQAYEAGTITQELYEKLDRDLRENPTIIFGENPYKTMGVLAGMQAICFATEYGWNIFVEFPLYALAVKTGNPLLAMIGFFGAGATRFTLLSGLGLITKKNLLPAAIASSVKWAGNFLPVPIQVAKEAGDNLPEARFGMLRHLTEKVTTVIPFYGGEQSKMALNLAKWLDEHWR